MGNNAKELREVCQQILDLLMLRGDGKAYCILTWDEFNESQKMLRRALSEPTRNCNVGTAEEQEKRFDKFCDAHKWVDDEGVNACSAYCPLYKTTECALHWAQMPYEETEGGAK